jgi:hypothetical protein
MAVSAAERGGKHPRATSSRASPAHQLQRLAILALVPQILHALAPSPEPTEAAAGAEVEDQEELERLVAVRHVLQGVVLYYRRLGLALGLPLPLKPPHCRDGPFTAKQRAAWPDCARAHPAFLGRVG